MSIVRNLVVLAITAATAAAVGSSMFGFMQPPDLFPTDNTMQPTVTTLPPNTPGFGTAGSQNFDPKANSLSPDFAGQALTAWGNLIDQSRFAADVPQLQYDPFLAQVAAVLLADQIANNPSSPSPVNSAGQTPIQQVQTQQPGVSATYASVLIATETAINNQAPAQCAQAVENSFTLYAVGQQVVNSPGWTNFGIAVQVVPGVPGQSNDLTYWAVFFAKYN